MAVLDGVETALITGASGGIGEAFARRLAALGKDLVVVARSENKLQALARELASLHAVQVRVIAADLARHDSAAALYAETERLGLAVDLLVNNAGFAKGGEFSQLSFEVQADMVRLNVNTLVELTRLYLPSMRARRRGGVINVASTAAFQPVPFMSVYGATKAFVLSFSEAVAEEVAGDGVTVMALCPGATATGFQETAGVWEGGQASMATADEVVAEALRAFEHRRRSFVQGATNKLMAFATRLGPRRLILHMTARVVGGHVGS
ncbi:MAG: SDR family NAD(P)-dependent oxidoreductase [Anaerolineae bacterium]|jgi:short-subunit dehydrogenase